MTSLIEAKLQKDINELRFQAESLQHGLDDANKYISALNRNVGNILTDPARNPPSAVANLLYNGELGHSVNSWHDEAYTTDDKAKECAYWFSHLPGEGVELKETDARTSATNNTLKTKDHSGYNFEFSRWDSSEGAAFLNGVQTVDALLPTNYFDKTTPLARASMIAARRTPYIELPEPCLMYAGIYDNTAGQRKFLSGSLEFTAGVSQVAASTVERRFRIQVFSDRGTSILSPEVVVANAPAAGFFDSTHSVVMNWKAVAGQLRVDVYEYLPSTGAYKLITEVVSGTDYIYLGDTLETVSGYPVNPVSQRSACFYTRRGEIANLAINGVSGAWDTVNFPIEIPDNYEKTVTTGRQWLRIGLTHKGNILTAITTDGTTKLEAENAPFEPEYAAGYAGALAHVIKQDGTLVKETTVASLTDENTIVLAAAVDAGENLFLRVWGVGFFPVIIDKIHLGFQQNTSYAPNAYDNRKLQPLSAPTTSAQGGTGGGGGGGGILCVKFNTPIKQADETWKQIRFCHQRELWSSGEFRPNSLQDLAVGYAFTRSVTSENGCFIEATDTERFVIDRLDENGTPLYRLRVGDAVLTEIDGRIESSRIVEISPLSDARCEVYTPKLSGSKLFVGGRRLPSVWERIKRFLLRRKTSTGGFVLHNQKAPVDDDYRTVGFV